MREPQRIVIDVRFEAAAVVFESGAVGQHRDAIDAVEHDALPRVAAKGGAREAVDAVERHTEMQAQRVLRVEVERDHTPAAGGENGSQVGSKGGLADPTLRRYDRNDFHERRGPLVSHEWGAGVAAAGASPRKRSNTEASGAAVF